MAKHMISGVSSVGVADKIFEVKNGVVDIPKDVELSDEWKRLHGELVRNPDITFEPYTEPEKK